MRGLSMNNQTAIDLTAITNRQRCKIAEILVGVRTRSRWLAGVCNRVIEAVHLGHPDAANQLKAVTSEIRQLDEFADQVEATIIETENAADLADMARGKKSTF